MHNESSRPAKNGIPLICLIVDDSAFARFRMKKMMESFNCVSSEAANGLEAIAAYQRLKPDLVLMDIVMPELEGIETVRQICSTDPEARIIMISSVCYQDKIEEALSAGARCFIPKPVTTDRLRQAIEKVCSAVNAA